MLLYIVLADDELLGLRPWVTSGERYLRDGSKYEFEAIAVQWSTGL